VRAGITPTISWGRPPTRGAGCDLRRREGSAERRWQRERGQQVVEHVCGEDAFRRLIDDDRFVAQVEARDAHQSVRAALDVRVFRPRQHLEEVERLPELRICGADADQAIGLRKREGP
jgi:hypothetical protein